MIISTGTRMEKKATPSHRLTLRWREEKNGVWERKEETIRDFHPYLFINPTEFYVKQVRDRGQWRDVPARRVRSANVESMISDALYNADSRQRPVAVEKTDADGKPFVDADGNTLWKVVFDNPSWRWTFQKRFHPTYEADVPYEDRFLIDRVTEVPKYRMRKLFIDLESLQFKSGDGPDICDRPNDPRDRQEVVVIGAYDNYSDLYYQWVVRESEEREVPMVVDGVNILRIFCDDEYDLLKSFVEMVDELDPDAILAWGMGFYDLPTLYRRLESHGIGANNLSPSSMGTDQYMMHPRYKGHQYRWTEQPVKGRIIISLDRLFERIYRDSKSTNLPSLKLDIVGQKLFKMGKTEFKPDFYSAGSIVSDDGLFYNIRDVKLMVIIERDYNLIEGQQNLQQLAKCCFKSTFYGSSYARVYFMRKAGFKQKTGWESAGAQDDWDLTGAIVLDPEEIGTVGLHKNTVILDFAGLYPSMMVAYNASWETKVKPGEESETDIIGDGCRFKREPMGILPSCVKELDSLRDHYKDLRKKASEEHGKASNEYRKWDDAQKTVKRLRATFYGLQAFQGFAWADIDIARTITYGGRNALRAIMEKSEEKGYKVLYGHTDSIFVGLGDDLTPEECAAAAHELEVELTEFMQAELKSDAVEVEAELIMDRFYLPRRNRYAGRTIWDPSLENPHSIAELPVESRIKMQGLEAKHTNTAKIGRDAQMNSLKMIWDETDPREVLDYLRCFVQDIKDSKIPLEDMIARARLGKWIPSDDLPHEGYRGAATNSSATVDAMDETDQCYSRLSGNQRGAAWHNVILATDAYPALDKGDSYYYTFVNEGPTWIPTGGYVAFHDIEQIDEYSLDIDMIIEKNVISKLDHIMSGIGLSNDMLRKEDYVHLSVEDFR